MLCCVVSGMLFCSVWSLVLFGKRFQLTNYSINYVSKQLKYKGCDVYLLSRTSMFKTLLGYFCCVIQWTYFSVSNDAYPPEVAGRFSLQRCGTVRVSTAKSGCDPDWAVLSCTRLEVLLHCGTETPERVPASSSYTHRLLIGRQNYTSVRQRG